MRIRIILASSVFALSALAQACSGGDTSSSSRRGFVGGGNTVTGGGDAGTQKGVGGDDAGTTPVQVDAEAPPTAGECNYQVNNATPVTVRNSSSSLPAGAGGVQPLDGEYQLTTVTHYGGSGANDSYKATAFLSAGTHQYVISKNGATDVRTTVSVEYQPNGTLLWTGKCGTTTVATLSYTAPTETSLVVYDSTSNMAFTYTRPAPPDPTP